MTRALFITALSWLLSSCQDPDLPTIEFVANPAASGAGQASLSVAVDGGVLLSWVEQSGAQAELKFARWQGRQWSAAQPIAAGDNWFVNWADFPALFGAADGRLVAHWLQRTGEASYAYEVQTQVSTDRGVSWRSVGTPHRDGTPTEHGFVSYFNDAGGPAVVWLDGRNTGGGHGDHGGAMTLRTTALANTGAWAPSQQLDGRVCDCCQTGAALTSSGPVVVYRDRSADEIRDIAVVRRLGGRWTQPELVHSDNWRIDACPVNGPAIAALDQQVAVAWFTMAGGEPVVNIATSSDSGANFSSPLRLDRGRALGRVDVAMLADRRIVASWLATDAYDDTRVQLALIADGEIVQRTQLGQTSPARGSGFPRLAIGAERVFVVWREVDETSARLRTALVSFGDG